MYLIYHKTIVYRPVLGQLKLAFPPNYKYAAQQICRLSLANMVTHDQVLCLSVQRDRRCIYAIHFIHTKDVFPVDLGVIWPLTCTLGLVAAPYTLGSPIHWTRETAPLLANYDQSRYQLFTELGIKGDLVCNNRAYQLHKLVVCCRRYWLEAEYYSSILPVPQPRVCVCVCTNTQINMLKTCFSAGVYTCKLMK